MTRLDIGRLKNTNKNPVAERAIQELEQELVRLHPHGGMITDISLVKATAQLNSRLRYSGLSAREMFFQRDQFTNQQIHVSDISNIANQYYNRVENHPHSEASKAPNKGYSPKKRVAVGDLVYVNDDYDKHKSRDRYIVVRIDTDFVYLRKFSGNQFRSASYQVKPSQCIKVSDTVESLPVSGNHGNAVCSDSEVEFYPVVTHEFVNTDEIVSDNNNQPCASEPADNNEPSPVHSSTLEPELWSEWPRRIRRQPQRLDITSWKDKSYDK